MAPRERDSSPGGYDSTPETTACQRSLGLTMALRILSLRMHVMQVGARSSDLGCLSLAGELLR